MTAPLVDLTRQEFSTRPRFKRAWGSAHDTAFADIERLRTSAPVLNFPHYEWEFVVHVDASKIRVDAFLAQPSKNDESKRGLDVIAYFSKRFGHRQRHYSASMKQCCGVVLALAHGRRY